MPGSERSLCGACSTGQHDWCVEEQGQGFCPCTSEAHVGVVLP